MARRTLNPLATWLALDWSHPERSYNPDLNQFLMGLLGYQAAQVQVEIQGPGGYRWDVSWTGTGTAPALLDVAHIVS
jgi:hypothetical protein